MPSAQGTGYRNNPVNARKTRGRVGEHIIADLIDLRTNLLHLYAELEVILQSDVCSVEVNKEDPMNTAVTITLIVLMVDATT